MALLQSDITTLRKSAINFLYIFIDPNATGLSADIMSKREKQLAELVKIYEYNAGYSLADLINIVRMGITERYNKTPEQMLQTIYDAAAVPEEYYNAAYSSTNIGATMSTPDIEQQTAQAVIDKAAVNVKSLETTVTSDGSTSKKNVWADVATVLEWLVALISKIFGSSSAGAYSLQYYDWTGKNAPRHNNTTSQSSLSFLPILLIGGTAYYMYTKKNKSGKKPKKNKS